MKQQPFSEVRNQEHRIMSQPILLEEKSPIDVIQIPGFNPHPIFNASCNMSKKKENSMTAKRIYSKAHQSPNRRVNANCFEQQYQQIEEYTSKLSKGLARLGMPRNSPGLEGKK